MSHLFSVITYEPLLNDICELIFFIGDEKIFNQMCSSMNEDYLLEPKSLLNYLNEMNSPSASSTGSTESKSATRSKSKLKSKSYTDFKSTSNETLTASASVVESNLSQLALQNEHLDDENDVYVDTQEDDLNDEKEEDSEAANVILPIREKQAVNEIHSAENITDDEKYRKINSVNNMQINGYV